MKCAVDALLAFSSEQKNKEKVNVPSYTLAAKVVYSYNGPLGKRNSLICLLHLGGLGVIVSLLPIQRLKAE